MNLDILYNPLPGMPPETFLSFPLFGPPRGRYAAFVSTGTVTISALYDVEEGYTLITHSLEPAANGETYGTEEGISEVSGIDSIGRFVTGAELESGNWILTEYRIPNYTELPVDEATAWFLE